MKIRLPKLTFRKKIVLTVVILASVPLILFGINSLRLAGQFQETSEQIKNRLLFSLSTQAEDYFVRLNESLAFIQNIEKQHRDISQSRGIIFNALQANREMLSIAYVAENSVDMYFGDETLQQSLEGRISDLLNNSAGAGGLRISESFEKNGARCFDLLYELRTGEDEALFMTFSLKELHQQMRASKIDETGEFALVSGQGNLFAGQPALSRRLSFLRMDEILEEAGGGVVMDDIRGYQVRGRRLDLAFPLWLVFTQQRREAYALTSKLRMGMILFLVLILSVSVGVSFILASEFSKPISNLLEAVKKNYSGKLEVKAKLREKDKGELALLIKGFNKMIDGLRESREKLVEKEKLAAVGEMANVIGHDIRNPLGAIKNGAYFLRYSLESDNERVSKTIDIIEREIATITEIIENLLGYSRQRPPSLKPVDVNSLIEEAVSIIEVPENVEIVKEYKERLREYNMDRGEMKQVLVNIINNAVQACEENKGIVKIVTAEKEGNLVIRVIDNGVGIAREKLENIFKAFYSTKGGGTGLGMSSAKNIVERHEGTINVNSEINKGTEMIISIPLLNNK